MKINNKQHITRNGILKRNPTGGNKMTKYHVNYDDAEDIVEARSRQEALQKVMEMIEVVSEEDLGY
jgi:hypothetical protein